MVGNINDQRQRRTTYLCGALVEAVEHLAVRRHLSGPRLVRRDVHRVFGRHAARGRGVRPYHGEGRQGRGVVTLLRRELQRERLDLLDVHLEGGRF